MADKPKSPGFPQKYNESPSEPPAAAALDPAAVVDLVTPQEEARLARASAKPAKPAKPAKRGRKPRGKK